MLVRCDFLESRRLKRIFKKPLTTASGRDTVVSVRSKEERSFVSALRLLRYELPDNMALSSSG